MFLPPHSFLALVLAGALLQAGFANGLLESRLLSRDEESAALSDTLFTRLGPEVTRIEYSHRILEWHPRKRLYHSSFVCGNADVGDLDLDGLPDLFLSGGPGSNKVYLQAEKLVFVDVTGGLQLSDSRSWAGGAVLVDIDNDLDLDIYVCYYDEPNRLYVNQIRESGRLWFENRAPEYGLDLRDASLVPAFADYDLDGDLDLYLVTHQLHREGGRPSSPIKLETDGSGSSLRITGELARYYELEEQHEASGEWRYTETGRPDLLFRNDDGRFRDVSASAGISRDRSVGNAATWWDADDDGDPDLYVSNDGFDPDRFYRNEGDGTFVEASASLLPRTPLFSRGTAVFDANEDGRTDLLVADLLPTTHYKRQASMRPLESHSSNLAEADGAPQSLANALFLGSPAGRLPEVAWFADLAATDWTWTVKAADFDHDGRQDLFFGNGAARNFKMADLPPLTHERLVGSTHWDHVESSVPAKPERNLAYRNRGGLRFEEISRSWGLAHVGMTHTCSSGDLDNDGDLDLVVCSLDEPVILYRNDGARGNAIRVRLRGTQSNSRGVGAKITVTTPSGTQVRELRCGGGYLDGDDASVHFGIGNYRHVQELAVQWPSGVRQRFTRLQANRLYTVTEQRHAAPSQARRTRRPWFQAEDALDSFPDKGPSSETGGAASLLPFALHQFAPCQAWGDVDGDGVPDLYLGARAGRSGRLVYNRTQPGDALEFEPWQQRTFEKVSHAEDMGAVFLDADSDGDLDLYVASGDPGLQVETAGESLQDRLFLNWDRGSMGRQRSALPDDVLAATCCVCAADFDRDGDIDLFAGSRSQPGDHPAPAPSYLLVNEDGVFRNATEDLAPALRQAGVVSSALWSDLDGDGWLDLAVAGPWNAPRVFRNVEGRLQPPASTRPAFPAGLWTGLASGDLDADGDLDLVASNLGLNTPYRASPEAPALLFHGSFFDQEEDRILEAVSENGVWFPRRNLHVLSRAFPALAETWTTHRKFASTPLHRLVSLDALRAAHLGKAEELRSGVFINEGRFRFRFAPFPDSAQWAPALGVALADFDFDGILDCFLGQNFSHAALPTGPLRSGAGVLLQGRRAGPEEGEHRFRALRPAESGIRLPGDCRSVVWMDLNRDHRPDLVAGINQDSPAVFLHQGKPSQAPLAIRLQGAPGNPSSIGTRVTVLAPGLPRQTREVQAGSGFLSSAHGDALLFARPRHARSDVRIQVRWPDGSEQTRVQPAEVEQVRIAPERDEVSTDEPEPEAADGEDDDEEEDEDGNGR